MNRILLILLMTLSGTGMALGQVQKKEKEKDLQSLQSRADSLYTNFMEEEAMNAYLKILDRDSTHLEALWRTSFLYSRIGNQKEEKAAKKEYFRKAEMFAARALSRDSTHSNANFVMAVAKGRMALASGTKERVAASRAIKKYGDRALRYDSTNAGAWHLLGRWHYRVANLNFFERLAANTLFGGIPDDASNEKAAAYIERAIELDNRFALYYHDLAEAYEEMDRMHEAIMACKKALEKDNLSEVDVTSKADCRRWLKEWKE